VLIRKPTLDAIRSGEVDLAFRRWRRPTVRAGGELRTAVGVLAIGAVDVVEAGAIDEHEARRAGFRSRDELLAELGRRGSRDPIHRIEIRYAGADPRIALRERSEIPAAELAELRARLERLDARREEPWVLATLELIGAQPGTPAATLAARRGRERDGFKRDVRKLKELGLTESLSPGYRLSPRGRAALIRLRTAEEKG